jgi:biopolymer transport protein ExbD
MIRHPVQTPGAMQTLRRTARGRPKAQGVDCRIVPIKNVVAVILHSSFNIASGQVRVSICLMRHKRDLPEGEFNLTSMIDLVFFLLIFFMTASTLARGGDDGVPIVVPDSSSAAEKEDGPRRLVVTVHASGEFALDGARIGEDVLERELRKAAGGKAARVVVRAEREARFSAVRAVLRAAAQAGVPDVLFATKRDEG